jgi:hypothetical protein|tara:strand:- start:265 stop:612 length:348 start_codon:yes stop_codon:yes gene_type:complete
MLQFEINRETGDVILKSDHGMLIIDQQDRDYLTDQLRYARQDETQEQSNDILETKEALKSKLALYELYQDQEYWANKWQNQNAKSMREYINFHTADKARDAAIKSGLDLDDLLFF